MYSKQKWNSLFKYYMIKVHGISKKETEAVLKSSYSYMLDPQMAARNYIHRNIDNNNICGGW